MTGQFSSWSEGPRGEVWACSICLANLARVSQFTGKYAPASTSWQESLELFVLLHDGVGISRALCDICGLLVSVAERSGDLEYGRNALRLRAAAARQRESMGSSTAATDALTEQEPAVRALIGEAECTAALEEGARLSQKEGVALAFADLKRIE